VEIPAPAGSLSPLAVGEVGGGDKSTWNDAESPVPVSSRDPMMGPRDALVTIVLFSDFQCPYCARIRPTLDAVRETYGNDVRIVWKNLPLTFHQNARPAAEAAYGVFLLRGNAAFWTFHALAFEDQQHLSQESYIDWARSAGVTDTDSFARALDAHLWGPKIDIDLELAKQLGVQGTPGTFVNGVFISGAQPFAKFKEVIDVELAKARALVAQGTPSSRVYVAASKASYRPMPSPDDDDDDRDDTKTVWKVPAGSVPMRGPADALVTIVEFGDFQCPYCSRVQPTLEALRNKYGNDLRILFRQEPLPFHPRAEPAAELALEARAEKGDAGFWAAHDLLFANQRSLGDQDLESYALKLGLDRAKTNLAISAHKFRKAIEADEEVAEDYQANGTPHFFINGRRLVGAQPQAKFEAIIDDELAKTRALVSAGTARAKVYEKVTENGRTPPPPETKTVALPTRAPSKGNAKAKVVIQVFSDFQCPFCNRVEPTIEEIMKNYGTRVRLVWRNLPLPMHPDAPLAAQAGVEAFEQKGSDGFWKLHDVMFANQGALKRDALDTYAQQIGLDMKKWNNALDNGTHKAAVDAEAAVANNAGISGTPAFVINNYFISGAQPYAKFKKIIERALAEAK
jgi:protein-disulfide isomerase